MSTKPNQQTAFFQLQNLPAHYLLPLLITHLSEHDNTAEWGVCWLQNKTRPIIGILPKVSWCVYPNSHLTNNRLNINEVQPHYQIIKTERQTSAHTNTQKKPNVESYALSLSAWCDELIAYMNQYQEDISDVDKPLRYHHGLMGFIGYDISAQNLSPNANIHLEQQPCAFFGHYDMFLQPLQASTTGIKNNNDSHNDIVGWQLIYHKTADSDAAHTKVENAHFIKLYECLTQLDTKLNHHLKESRTNITELFSIPPSLIMQPLWSQADYQHAFERTQNYLYAGDCYQINLTQPWIGNLLYSQTLIEYLPNLYTQTHAPYAGYFAVNSTALKQSNNTNNKLSDTTLPSFELLSCSPELFLRFESTYATHSAITMTAKPIKGTIPRGESQQQDEANKQTLAASEKDCAENVMIVDLLRNDLGKYATTGSVRVPHLFALESFSNVHHLVSTIKAELKPTVHPLTALFASLPAGSITGTPKKRAVEIIDELEACSHQHSRGAYCGSLGFMNFDGTGQFNVLIRTLQSSLKNNRDESTTTHRQVTLWAGGGITVASNANSEYQECWDKVGNLLAILQN
ncbi:anthranilate synthase component I family protein [Psychrobacter sp. I-STPA10]|uniref:anthranilate synthase component I family protein n=1 Tax=Psychrobacter sp. I-STPA10 TaxID=2585769 RepID=UPI001E2BC1E2|nr:anthranilate synthase component I family protein [Psychrobacter sp. I-STPA10]